MIAHNMTAIAIAAALALALGAGGGLKVGQWRAEAAAAERVQGLNDRITQLTEDKRALEAGIAESNKALAVAAAQTQAADEAREQAQRHAADLAQFSQSRMDKLAKAFEKASTCGEVLNSYWELRK